MCVSSPFCVRVCTVCLFVHVYCPSLLSLKFFWGPLPTTPVADME